MDSKIKEKTKIKIIANGEIWTEADFQKCLAVTNCSDFMIGRGALRDPYIFRKIKNDFTNTHPHPSLDLVIPFFDACTIYVNEHFATARTNNGLASFD